MELRQASDLHPGGGAAERTMFPPAAWRLKTALKSIVRRAQRLHRLLKPYLGLSEAGYRHKAVNHSVVEWVGVNATSADARTGLPYLGLGWRSSGRMQGQPEPLLGALGPAGDPGGWGP